jgi:undecaprenyl-diphosphatase
MASLLQFIDDLRRAERRFWLQLVVGAAALLAAGWLFGKIAEDVVTGDLLTVIDEWLAAWLHRRATPSLTRAMFVVTELAGSAAITALTLATALLLVWMHRWHWLLTLVLVVPAGALLNELLKIVFHRARPAFDHPILTVTGHSFPSGHTMIATLLYGFLAVFLFQAAQRWRWRALGAIGAALLIPLVAVSRMYLGAHYLSDTLAAIAAGVIWLVLCLTAVAMLRRRARRR